MLGAATPIELEILGKLGLVPAKTIVPWFKTGVKMYIQLLGLPIPTSCTQNGTYGLCRTQNGQFFNPLGFCKDEKSMKEW